MVAIQISATENKELGEKLLTLFPNRRFILIYFRDQGDEQRGDGLVRAYMDGDMNLNDWKSVHEALDRGIQEQLAWAVADHKNRNRIV